MIPLLVSTLLQQGMALLGNAVLAKGKDVIEEKLGIDLEESVKTEAGLLELKKLEFSHQEFLISAAQSELVESNRNTADARAMNTAVQTAPEASTLAKNAAYILDFLIVGSTILLATLLYFKQVPNDNQNLVYLALGSLITMCGTILNFHRGSTSGSKNKDAVISAISSRRAEIK